MVRYTHPTRLHRYGRELAVVPFEGPDGASFAQLVEERLRNSGYVISSPSVARIVVTGQVRQSAFGAEQVGERPHTCYRQVPELRTRQVPVLIPLPAPPPPPNNPYYIAPPPQFRTEYRTEQYTEMVSRPYACTELWRAVDASFHVLTWVRTRSRPIQTVDAQNIAVHDRQETRGLRGSDANDGPPPPVNGPWLLSSLHHRALEDFAEETTPRPESVEIEFANCHDDRCEQALTLVRAGDLGGAEALYDQVVRRYESDNSTSGRERRAAALYNRGVTRGFRTDIDGGIADVRSAIALDADAGRAWSGVLQRLDVLKQERDASTFRGETRLGAGAADDATEAPAAPRPAPRRRGR